MRSIRFFKRARVALFFGIFGLMFALPVYAAPANDDLANATVIDPAGLEFSDAVVVDDMTEEVNEVDATCADTIGSLWWSFTPDTSGTYLIDTFGSLPSADDTVLSLHEDGTHPLTEIACNDQAPGAGTSFLIVDLTAGTTYLIRAAEYDNGTSLDGGTILLHVGLFTPPGNDDLANATVIDPTGLPYSDIVDTTDMTEEVDEVDASCQATVGSLWWSFTPNYTGNYRIDTDGSENPAHDTVLSVYEDGGHPLIEIACDDDGGVADNNSALTLALDAGTTYLIRVANYDDDGIVDVGNVHLNVNYAPPDNDDVANATVIAPTGLPYSNTVFSGGTTEEVDEVDASCQTTVGSLWWSFTPNYTGDYRIDTDGSENPAHDTVLSVYADGGHPLTEIACDDDSGLANNNSALTLTLDAGTTYLIRVADWDDGLDAGNVHLNVSYTPPDNDDVANATVIDPASLEFSDAVVVDGMTEEVDEVDATCADTIGSLWWSFTPDTDGTYLIDTFGSVPSANDTVLSLHEDGAHPLTEIACNNDAPSDTTSFLIVDLTAGTTYLIRAAEYDNALPVDGGTIVLHVGLFTPPANDDWANATVIDPTGLPYSDIVNTTDMTEEVGEGDPTCSGTVGSVWWSFTPSVTGVYQIDTIGSENPANDTVLSVHTGSGHPLTEVGCDDDSGVTNNNSALTLMLDAGTTYYIRVADYDDNGMVDAGNVHLNVTSSTAPANDDLANAIGIDPSSLPYSSVVYSGGMTQEVNEVEASCGDTVGSLWWSFTPTVDATYTISTFGSEFPADDTILSIYTGSVHPLTEVACSDDASFDSTSALYLALTSGTTYYIRVADWDDGLDAGNVRLTVSGIETGNDDLANAIVIDPSSLPYSTSADTIGMTQEVDEADATCTGTEGSLWWSFTPTVGGLYLIHTVGSQSPANDTVLSVHTGSGHPLAEVACNDDMVDSASVVTPVLNAGTTYYIRVADYGDTILEEGIIALSVEYLGAPPANDNLANATVIDPLGLPYGMVEDVTAATLEGGEETPDCVVIAGGGEGYDDGSVWWSFTPSADGMYQIDTAGSEYPAEDTTLAVYTGSGFPLTLVGCNEDASGSDYTSVVQLNLTGGTTYYIRVGLRICECDPFVSGIAHLNVSALDLPTVSISPATETVNEGSSTTVTVSRYGGNPGIALNVSVTLTGSANTSDYTISGNIDAQTGAATVTIPAGSLAANLTVTVNDDSDAEGEDTLIFEVGGSADYLLSADMTTISIPRADLGVSNLNSSGDGSLAQAIDNANTFGGANEIVIPDGTISVPVTLVISSDLTLTGGTGTILSGSGGTVIQINGGTVLLRGFTITGGTVSGVAVYGGNVTIGNDPIFIIGNSSPTCGGGVYVTGATVTIHAASQINSNSAPNGGGVCVDNGTVIVEDAGTQINGNTATGSGGGIYVIDGTLTVQTGAVVNGNNAVDGAGIFTTQSAGSSSVTIQTGASVSGNTATGTGGGIYHEGGGISINGSYLQGNSASNSGAIRFGVNGSVTNTCIVLNSDVAVTFAGGSGIVATGNWWGSEYGPYTGLNTPDPNDANTEVSTGDAAQQSFDPNIFDYAGYLTTAPSGCYACTIPSGVGGGDRVSRVCPPAP